MHELLCRVLVKLQPVRNLPFTTNEGDSALVLFVPILSVLVLLIS